MIEKEIKILISLYEYKILDDYFNWNDDYVQNNFYYETKNDEYITDTIRIRSIRGRNYLQVKVNKLEEGLLHISEEFERELKSIPQKIRGKDLQELTNILTEDAYLIGSLRTYRKTCRLFHNIEIVLDENKYEGVVDYELEIEYRGEYPTKLVQTLSKLGVNIEGESIGKYTRFKTQLNKSRLGGVYL